MSYSSELHTPLDQPGRLLVVSPHFDDGVFGAGGLLGGRPGSRLLTVFGAAPKDAELCTDWDRRSGFANSVEAVAARRAEDEQAARALGAEVEWLDFLDSQYGAPPHADVIAAALARVIDAGDFTIVAFPLGLFHSDHELVREACLTILDGWPDIAWLGYEDALYRRIAGVVQAALAEFATRGLVATPVWPQPAGAAEAKQIAVGAYESQLVAFDPAALPDLGAPERYWLITPGADDE